ncbi:MAG TPA: nucleotidyl transferase AbiEii/AbiGii toxin family protein [Kofleriaceae bacterium]|nr:nucleotidyl transferase AbiEii/AbiGii toxin family protein [Kofleriaceae bacterium]
MPIGRLSSLQERVLRLLADIEPPWTLTGGAALAGFHTHHRATRDLDLFFRPQAALGTVVGAVREHLERDGLNVAVLRTSPSFSQLEIRDASESVVVDLVADPTPIAEPPRAVPLGAAMILVDTPHQLLVNKLCALLSRSELRDLVDVRELLRGGDLERALEDCPRQDAGFSPLTFGWSMRGLRIDRLAAALGWASQDIVELERFRDELVDRVVAAARPPS